MANHPKGYDLSHERITALLEKLDNPQNRLPPVIHVAGTNGKGSTIAFMRAIFEASGMAVHVHTSPHLVNWHERFRIGKKGGGELVTDEILSKTIERVAKANQGQAITVFEILTVVTFILFAEHPADVCLIEVGLGGRFDATNVMKHTDITVITPISIDHESHLGDTLAKIAFEKAGIIKNKTPVVIGLQESAALEVIVNQAAKYHAPPYIHGQEFHGHEENGRLIFQDQTALLDLDKPNLFGAHQISNASTAIMAARVFVEQQRLPLSSAMIDEGLKKVQWPGRMQWLQHGTLLDHAPQNSEIWLDGGHNPSAAKMISNFLINLNKRDPRPTTLICGMLNTKDPKSYFEELSGEISRFITVPIDTSDAGIPAQDLAAYAQACGLKGNTATNLTEALTMIEGECPGRILIAGSLYLVGDALFINGTPPQ